MKIQFLIPERINKRNETDGGDFNACSAPPPVPALCTCRPVCFLWLLCAAPLRLIRSWRRGPPARTRCSSWKRDKKQKRSRSAWGGEDPVWATWRARTCPCWWWPDSERLRMFGAAHYPVYPTWRSRPETTVWVWEPGSWNEWQMCQGRSLRKASLRSECLPDLRVSLARLSRFGERRSWVMKSRTQPEAHLLSERKCQ